MKRITDVNFNVLQLPINIFLGVEKFREAQLFFVSKGVVGNHLGRNVGSSIFLGVLRLEDHAFWCVVFRLKPLNKTPWSGVLCIALPRPWNAPNKTRVLKTTIVGDGKNVGSLTAKRTLQESLLSLLKGKIIAPTNSATILEDLKEF